jgi:hypothetical protein
VAESTGVAEGNVGKVLDFMGLERVLNEVQHIGLNVEIIKADNLKAATRISNNTIPV